MYFYVSLFMIIRIYCYKLLIKEYFVKGKDGTEIKTTKTKSNILLCFIALIM